MKIIKKCGNFVILTPRKWLKEQLLIIEKAGRTCYQSEKGKITAESADKFIRMVMKREHESVIEHSVLTVQFNDCSRGFTHELVRHRLAAFSQESTRYVDYAKSGDAEVDLNKFEISCVVPPHRDHEEKITLSDGRMLSFTEMLEENEEHYRALRLAGWKPEDARQILPTALKAQIVVSANFREWRHIMKMRTDKAAHWEIRIVMCDLLDSLKKIIPVIFEDFEFSGFDANGYQYTTKKQR